jgi:hypothetical protein
VLVYGVRNLGLGFVLSATDHLRPRLGWFGIEREAPCDHGLKLRKFIAFEGTNIRKRFIGCAKEVWIIYIAKLMFE